jgi:quinol monooxygenase YgiN
MSVLLIAEVKVKTETKEELKAFLNEILPDTRSFEGNEGIDVYFDIEETDVMVLVEKWQSSENYNKYHDWRVSTGVIDKLRTFLVGKPSRRFLELADV